jgi:hypothetical protein
MLYFKVAGAKLCIHIFYRVKASRAGSNNGFHPKIDAAGQRSS